MEGCVDNERDQAGDQAPTAEYPGACAHPATFNFYEIRRQASEGKLSLCSLEMGLLISKPQATTNTFLCKSLLLHR